jgi:zinc transporter ZupT
MPRRAWQDFKTWAHMLIACVGVGGIALVCYLVGFYILAGIGLVMSVILGAGALARLLRHADNDRDT